MFLKGIFITIEVQVFWFTMFSAKLNKSTLFSKIILFGIFAVLLITLSNGFGARYYLKQSENNLVLADLNHIVEKPVSLDLTPHEPIDIRSRSGFTSFPGSGTEINPYIIEGYSIITTDFCGIRIDYTSSFFIIRNCYVDAENYGIRIYNVAEGTATIINNTCTNTLYGITIQHSSGVTLTNNTCTNNRVGISLSSSSCLVKNNLLQGNEHSGIHMSISSNDNIIQNNYFLDNNQFYDSQATDDGRRNKWYDAEKKAGNYWSDLGDQCTYKIEGRARSKDLYPLNRALDCPNPIVISIISIVLPILCTTVILAFIVPKYIIPYSRKTIIPNIRKQRAVSRNQINKLLSCPKCEKSLKSSTAICDSCDAIIPKRNIFTNFRLKIAESKSNRVTAIVYLVSLVLSIIIAPLVIGRYSSYYRYGWLWFGLFGLLPVLLPLACIILLVLFRQEIGRMKLKKKVPLITMSVAFIVAMVTTPLWVMIWLLANI